MITDLVVTAILGALTALLSLVPSWTAPTMEGSSGLILGQYLSRMNTVLPMGTIVSIIAASLALRLILASWDSIVWLFHQFWGSD